MTKWLERKEKIIQHAAFVKWKLDGQPPLPNYIPLHPPLPPRLTIAKRYVEKVSFNTIEIKYQAPFIRDALARFMVQLDNPDANPNQIERLALDYIFHTQVLPVYHKFKLWLGNPQEHRLMSDEFDIIHASPSRKGTHDEKIAARFDTVLVHLFPGIGPYRGVRGIVDPLHIFSYTNFYIDYRVGQIKLIFEPPPCLVNMYYGESPMPKYLVYIE